MWSLWSQVSWVNWASNNALKRKDGACLKLIPVVLDSTLVLRLYFYKLKKDQRLFVPNITFTYHYCCGLLASSEFKWLLVAITGILEMRLFPSLAPTVRPSSYGKVVCSVLPYMCTVGVHYHSAPERFWYFCEARMSAILIWNPKTLRLAETTPIKDFIGVLSFHLWGRYGTWVSN